MSSNQESGNYFPQLSSQKDVDRLRVSHQVVKLAMKNGLVIAPINTTKDGLRILDVCTSDGIWLLDVRNDLGAQNKHSFVGVDIDGSRFPSDPPPNVTLQVQNVHSQWPSGWKDSFDLVHMRFGFLAAEGDPQAVCNSLLDLVKPGGWFQSVEPELSAADDDPPANHQFHALVRELVALNGQASVISRIPEMVKEAGLVNVNEEIITSFIGAKIADPTLREISVESQAVVIEGLVSRVKSTMLNHLKCMTAEELDSLPARYREEISQHGGATPIRIVWGQKPE